MKDTVVRNCAAIRYNHFSSILHVEIADKRTPPKCSFLVHPMAQNTQGAQMLNSSAAISNVFLRKDAVTSFKIVWMERMSFAAVLFVFAFGVFIFQAGNFQQAVYILCLDFHYIRFRK